MSDLDRRLQEYWDKVVETHPTPTAQEILDRSEDLVVTPARQDTFRTRLIEARPWLVGVAGFVAVLFLATLIYTLTGADEQLQEPVSPPPSPVEPGSSELSLTVVLPDGDLHGDHFPGGVSGFQYLVGDDPSNEANWHDWPGGSASDGTISIPQVAQGVTAGDWVGLRHPGGDEQAIIQIISFTFDEWDLEAASGTIDPAAVGVVMVGWWDPVDPENIFGNAEKEVVDGTWRVDGLQATQGSSALAFWQGGEGNYQVVGPP